MTSSFLDSCPRCHGEKSFRFAKRHTLTELLLLKWVRRSTLRCTHCGYRLNARLSAADKQSLKSSAGKTSGRPVVMPGPNERPIAKGTSEFSAFIEGMQQREHALASAQDRPDQSDQKDLGRTF